MRSLDCWSFMSKVLFSVSTWDPDIWAGRKWLFQGLLLSNVNRRHQIKVFFFFPYLSSSSEESHRGQLQKPYWLAQFLKYRSWNCQHSVKPTWLQHRPHFEMTATWTRTAFFHARIRLGARVLTPRLCWDSERRSTKSRKKSTEQSCVGKLL